MASASCRDAGWCRYGCFQMCPHSELTLMEGCVPTSECVQTIYLKKTTTKKKLPFSQFMLLINTAGRPQGKSLFTPQMTGLSPEHPHLARHWLISAPGLLLPTPLPCASCHWELPSSSLRCATFKRNTRHSESSNSQDGFRQQGAGFSENDLFWHRPTTHQQALA